MAMTAFALLDSSDATAFSFEPKVSFTSLRRIWEPSASFTSTKEQTRSLIFSFQQMASIVSSQ